MAAGEGNGGSTTGRPAPATDMADVAQGADVAQSKANARAVAKRFWLTHQPDHAASCVAVASFLASTVGQGWVVTYRPMANEVNLDPLLAQPELGPFAVTRTPERADGYRLSVHPVDAPVERHRYGYLQPVADAPVVPDSQIRAVLVPALAFDRDGNRLGRGVGYYDRFLARLEGKRCAFVGITGGHVVDRVPVDHFDIPMTHLLIGNRVHPVPAVDG